MPNLRHHTKSSPARRVFGISLVAVLAGVIFLVVLNFLFPLPDHVEYSTIVTDDKGEVIHAFLTRDQQWRMKTELDEISPLLRKTIIAKEDKYFYYHWGINPLSIFKSLVKNLVERRRATGASTITMQVARALEPKKRTYFNKCVEMFRALQLESKYKKDEILQLYLNLVPYGGNIQGVKSAATLYFKKNPDQLSLAEITTLAIIPNRPSSLVIGKNNPEILRARNKWLNRLASENLFSAKEIQDALREPLTASRSAAPALVPQLAYRLKKSGMTNIHTHIRLNTQLKVESIVADYNRELILKNIHNISVVIIDNRDSRIISYIGSANFKDSLDHGQVDGVVAVRQPGSTLKPLLYGLCIDQGLLTPKRMITDVPVNFSGFAPENYDKKYNGFVTMEAALERSLNIPAVKSLNRLGKDKMIQALGRCQFQQVKKDQHKLGLSMILGGCGATLEELTGLYALFAHNGLYAKPSLTRDDTVRFSSRILSPAASYMISDILSKVNRPDFPFNWESTTHLPKISWKTGTSYGRRDAWSIGYNKHYTVGVWVGNFSGLGVPELNGANIATPLLFRIFNTIDYNADGDWFEQPTDCDSRIVCSQSGMPPGDKCPDLVSDYFIPLVSDSRKCEDMEEVILSADGKLSYCRACMPASGYRKKWFRILPPEMQQYYDKEHLAYEKIPPHNPACERIFQEGGPIVTSPLNGNEYLISKSSREPLQLSCRTGTDVSMVYWYINNKFYKATQAGMTAYFIPQEGPVKISCSDDKGRNKDIEIWVRFVNM